MVKNLAAKAGNARLVPESGIPPGVGNGSRLQYSCLETPHGQKGWWVIAHGMAKSHPEHAPVLTESNFKNSIKCKTFKISPLLINLFSLDLRVQLEGAPRRDLRFCICTHGPRRAAPVAGLSFLPAELAADPRKGLALPPPSA